MLVGGSRDHGILGEWGKYIKYNMHILSAVGSSNVTCLEDAKF
jgi:hypothetical protein